MARAKRGDTLSVTIDDLAFGGEGVGRVEGYVVFVPGGIPGDRLQVRLDQARARFGRGIIAGVESPSPYRVAAPCPYFGRCGGCRLQHVAYPAQLAFKSKQVADCLERLGGLGSFELRPIIGAPDTYGYRNKMEFTVARAAHRPSPHATTAGRAGDSPGARPDEPHRGEEAQPRRDVIDSQPSPDEPHRGEEAQPRRDVIDSQPSPDEPHRGEEAQPRRDVIDSQPSPDEPHRGEEAQPRRDVIDSQPSPDEPHRGEEA